MCTNQPLHPYTHMHKPAQHNRMFLEQLNCRGISPLGQSLHGRTSAEVSEVRVQIQPHDAGALVVGLSRTVIKAVTQDAEVVVAMGNREHAVAPGAEQDQIWEWNAVLKADTSRFSNQLDQLDQLDQLNQSRNPDYTRMAGMLTLWIDSRLYWEWDSLCV